MSKTATPADPHTTESICQSCGGAIYRTLLEGQGPTRTYWRHDATGYNGCPKAEADPARWRTNADGSLVCPHRDLSVCTECAAHPAVTEVVGAYFYDPTGEIADEVAEVLAR